MAEQIPHDDLFEGPSMTFGEHLEELRVSLFKSVVGIFVGVLLGLLLANHVVRFFQSPLEDAMRKYYLQTSLKEIEEEDFPNGVPPEIATMILERKLLPEKVPLDLGQFARAVDQQFPGELPPGNFSSYVYSLADFRAPEDKQHSTAAMQQLARKFADAEQATGTPAARVWELLSKEDRAAVASLAKLDAWKSKEETNFLQVLNRLIERPELHEAPEFTGKTLPPIQTAPTTEGEATEETPSGEAPLAPGSSLDKTRQRNKRVLAAAFSGQLQRPSITTVSIWEWKPVRVKFQVLNAQESFMIWMKAGVVTGIALASPWIFYQIWLFVASGLYRHEKNYVYVYLPFSLCLFLAGASLAFFFVFEPVLDFLFSFQAGMNADFEPRIGEWMSFVLLLPLGFGVSFQLPLVMLFLNRIGLIDVSLYTANWRISILIIFFLSMILTPADPISMLLMAVPLSILYALGILMCIYMPRGRSPFQEAYEP